MMSQTHLFSHSEHLFHTPGGKIVPVRLLIRHIPSIYLRRAAIAVIATATMTNNIHAAPVAARTVSPSAISTMSPQQEVTALSLPESSLPARDDAPIENSLSVYLRELTERSPYFGPSLSHAVIDERRIEYDPLVHSVVSTLYSRSPRRYNFARFEKITLPPPASWNQISSKSGPGPCPRNITAYIKSSSLPGAPVFIILPGYFTQWRTGVIYNRTLDLLRTWVHPDPTIVAFNGFLSPNFLKKSCTRVPALAAELTSDLYVRLHHLLTSQLNLSADQHVGVLGFSGGAEAALWLAAHDGRSSPLSDSLSHNSGGGEPPLWIREPLRPHPPLFHSTLAANPPLQPLAALKHLDDLRAWVMAQRHHHQGRPTGTQSFSDTLRGRILGVMKYIFVDPPLDWSIAWDAFQKNPDEFHRRAITQIAWRPLQETLKALPPQNDRSQNFGGERHTGFEDLFVHRGLIEYNPPAYAHLSAEERKKSYRRLTDLSGALPHISHPVALYYALDDPLYESPVPQELIKAIEKNPHAHLLYPSFGAHLGVFVDPIFPYLLNALFSQQVSQLGWSQESL